MNQWNLIAQHYKKYAAMFDATLKNEWAIDPYAWDGLGVRLTPIEAWMWHEIRAVDAVFYPQFPIAGFFVDFANPKAKVAIECDGADFHKDQEKDSLRDKRLVELGWRVYRITGKDCRSGVHGEFNKAQEFIAQIAHLHGLARL